MSGSVHIEKLKSLVWCLMLAYAVFLLPVDALAQQGSYSGAQSDSTVLGGLLCGVVKWFTGSVGKGIATLAIIVIGIGALMGKVSWGMAIIVGLGVAVIFGAPQLVEQLGANGASSCN